MPSSLKLSSDIGKGHLDRDRYVREVVGTMNLKTGIKCESNVKKILTNSKLTRNYGLLVYI